MHQVSESTESIAPSQTLVQLDWSEEFHAFSSFHLVVILVTLFFFASSCVLGKHLLSKQQADLSKQTSKSLLTERTFRHLFAYTILISQAFFFIRRLTPSHWDIQDSLPLHLCRWAVWIAAWAMLTLNPKARSLLLFWGLGLSTQAFITPMMTHGYSELSFWIYWINHIQIVGAAIYDIVVLGFRPSKRDLRFAIVAGFGYAILTIILNALLATNYSYLGEGAHSQSSVVDELGPYPQRLIWMILGATFIFVCIFLVSKASIVFCTRVLGKAPPTKIEA